MINTLGIDDNTKRKLLSLTERGTLNHAILVSGGNEDERQRLARYLANFTVCKSEGEKPCGACVSCKKAAKNMHPDIHIYEKPSKKRFYIKDDVKNLVSNAYITPNESDIKAIIIKELQNMNIECQNLLLKVLEEPALYSSFILTSNSKNVVIPTVISRVTVLDITDTGENRQTSKKVLETAKAISSAILSPNEFDIIIALSVLEGGGQEFFDVLLELSIIIRDALVKKTGGIGEQIHASSEAAELEVYLSKKQLIDLYDAVTALLEDTNKNKNKILMLTSLSTKLRRAVEL